VAQRSLRGLGAPALAPCHLAKQKDPDTHSNWSQQEANSVPILPQSASRHDAGGRNPHSNHLCRSTVRFGSKNRLQRSRKRGPRDAGALRVSFSLILGLEALPGRILSESEQKLRSFTHPWARRCACIGSRYRPGRSSHFVTTSSSLGGRRQKGADSEYRRLCAHLRNRGGKRLKEAGGS
jgi:hypothetical protein